MWGKCIFLSLAHSARLSFILEQIQDVHIIVLVKFQVWDINKCWVSPNLQTYEVRYADVL